MLDGFVDVIYIACDEGVRKGREHEKQRLNLTSDPALTLMLKVRNATDFLVKDFDVFSIVNVNGLPQKECLKFSVFDGRVQMVNVMAKPTVGETHARTNETCRKSKTTVTFTEETVVDFLADTIEYSNAVIGIFGSAMALDSLMTLLANCIQASQEVFAYNVIGVEDNYFLELFSCLVCLANGVLQRLGFGTFFKRRGQKPDGKGGKLFVCGRLHVVGDDDDRIEMRRIVLLQKGFDRVDDNGVFVIGGEKDKELAGLKIGAWDVGFVGRFPLRQK